MQLFSPFPEKYKNKAESIGICVKKRYNNDGRVLLLLNNQAKASLVHSLLTDIFMGFLTFASHL